MDATAVLCSITHGCNLKKIIFKFSITVHAGADFKFGIFHEVVNIGRLR